MLKIEGTYNMDPKQYNNENFVIKNVCEHLNIGLDKNVWLLYYDMDNPVYPLCLFQKGMFWVPFLANLVPTPRI